ncbi:protein of unknown function (plasmid) [Caballeronia sp. S22]
MRRTRYQRPISATLNSATAWRAAFVIETDVLIEASIETAFSAAARIDLRFIDGRRPEIPSLKKCRRCISASPSQRRSSAANLTIKSYAR